MTSGLAVSPKMKARILAVAHKAICDVISLYLLISFRFSHDNLLPQVNCSHCCLYLFRHLLLLLLRLLSCLRPARCLLHLCEGLPDCSV